MSERHWVIYGAALRAMHDTPLTVDLAEVVPAETFTARWTAAVRALDTARARWIGVDSVEGDVAALWQDQHAEIGALVERLETLGRRLRAARPSLVLCHGDVHHNNVLIDTDDRFWMIDWDDTRLAPKECDLMMGVGGLNATYAGPREETWFLRGYGPTTIDPIALAYYRHLRAVGDLAEYGEQVWLLQGASEATKRNALERTTRLFAPGSIVTLAKQLERFAV
jgi:spectinomycin phosphotransferase